MLVIQTIAHIEWLHDNEVWIGWKMEGSDFSLHQVISYIFTLLEGLKITSKYLRTVDVVVLIRNVRLPDINQSCFCLRDSSSAMIWDNVKCDVALVLWNTEKRASIVRTSCGGLFINWSHYMQSQSWQIYQLFSQSNVLAGARRDAVGWGTALQAGRSRVQFPMVSLDFFIDIILPALLWPWGWLSL